MKTSPEYEIITGDSDLESLHRRDEAKSARSRGVSLPAPNRTGLPDRLKAGVEALSGISLDAVRVHYNSPKPAELDALAYAQGADIYVAPGQVRHLPHEAWHVVQQAQGRIKPTIVRSDGIRINDDPAMEKEADDFAARAAERFTPSRTAGVDQDSPTQRLAGLAKPSLATENGRGVLQCKVGVEIELSQPKWDVANPLAKPVWEKRDLIYAADTWALTIDDSTTENKFNLEFIIRGKDGTGFEDAYAIAGIKTALTDIRVYLNKEAGDKNLLQTFDRRVRGSPLNGKLPNALPPDANVQVTAGLSLTGLHQLMLGGENENTDRKKVVSGLGRSESQVAGKYISPAQIKAELSGGSGTSSSFAVVWSDESLRALSGMASLLNVFVTNLPQESSNVGNIKQSSPILWKTPLNLFFDAPEMAQVKPHIGAVWPRIVELFGAENLNKRITYPPTGPQSKTCSVKTWLLALPVKDWLYDQDQYYDKSIGGIGRLEGGAGPSQGHPIFEFRAFPNSLQLDKLENSIEQAVKLWNGLNSTGERSSGSAALDWISKNPATAALGGFSAALLLAMVARHYFGSSQK